MFACTAHPNSGQRESVDKTHTQRWTDIVDNLFGYAYDERTTLGEHTVESGWTIAKLSSTLSWLDGPASVRDAMVGCVHRGLAYPVHRNWRLVLRVLDDVRVLLLVGRRAVVRALVGVRRVLGRCGPRQYLNTLFIEPFAVWVQGVSDATLGALAGEMARCMPTKQDVRWDLAEIEALARSDDGRAPGAGLVDDGERALML